MVKEARHWVRNRNKSKGCEGSGYEKLFMTLISYFITTDDTNEGSLCAKTRPSSSNVMVNGKDSKQKLKTKHKVYGHVI